MSNSEEKYNGQYTAKHQYCQISKAQKKKMKIWISRLFSHRPFWISKKIFCWLLPKLCIQRILVTFMWNWWEIKIFILFCCRALKICPSEKILRIKTYLNNSPARPASNPTPMWWKSSGLGSIGFIFPSIVNFWEICKQT